MSGTYLASYKSICVNVQCIRGERLISNGTTEDENCFDEENGMIVIAIDVNQNILIVYHQAINKYNMTSLLTVFNVKRRHNYLQHGKLTHHLERKWHS